MQELLKILDGRANLFDVQRAVAFLMVTHGSYNGTCKSVGIRTINVAAIIERMPKVADRIQSLVLENKDAKRTQYILRARYILNKSGKEIASDLNMPQNNVRMAIVRAKQKARKAMALRKTEKD